MDALLTVLGVVLFCVGASWVTAVALHVKRPGWASGSSQDRFTDRRKS